MLQRAVHITCFVSCGVGLSGFFFIMILAVTTFAGIKVRPAVMADIRTCIHFVAHLSAPLS